MVASALEDMLPLMRKPPTRQTIKLFWILGAVLAVSFVGRIWHGRADQARVMAATESMRLSTASLRHQHRNMSEHIIGSYRAAVQDRAGLDQDHFTFVQSVGLGHLVKPELIRSTSIQRDDAVVRQAMGFTRQPRENCYGSCSVDQGDHRRLGVLRGAGLTSRRPGTVIIQFRRSSLIRCALILNILNPTTRSRRWLVPVKFLSSPGRDLNTRFLVDSHIKTRCILSADDDIDISPEALEFGFQAWRMSKSPIVGYVPRRHRFDRQGDWAYDLTRVSDDLPYSMILVSSDHGPVNGLYMISQPAQTS